MKHVGMKHMKMLLGILFLTFMVACGSDDSNITASQPSGAPPWNSREACDYQKYPAGIPGNTYCPYGGSQINGRLEGFAQFEFNGAVYLDFGLKYNDQCPPGEVPVFEYQYGQVRLKSCDPIGEDYVDFVFFNHHNSSSCAGGYAGDQNCIPGMP